MGPVDLTCRTSFRLALGGALFILVALVLASSIGYVVRRQHLLARRDDRVIEVEDRAGRHLLDQDRLE